MNGEYNAVLKTVVAECGSVVLKSGNKVQTSVTAAMSDDSFYNIRNAKVTYKSSNTAVADVDESGLVTAIGPGVATITAGVTIDGLTKSDSYPLKVLADMTLSSIEMGGTRIENFSPDVHAYSYLTQDGSARPPKITATPSVKGTSVIISQAKAIPGTALITLTEKISDQTGIYAVNFGTPSYSDNFMLDTLRKQWSWIRENKDHWSLTESERYITITAEDGDIRGSVNNAKNILLQTANSDWLVDSRIEFSKRPSKPDQQGGLIAYQDDDNYVKLVSINSIKGFLGGDEYIELLVENNGSQYSAANISTKGIISDDLSITLRLEKNGSMYTAWYSPDGRDFKLLGSTDVVLSDIRVGMIACNGGTTPGGGFAALMPGINGADAIKPFKVRFDYFQIRNAGNAGK